MAPPQTGAQMDRIRDTAKTLTSAMDEIVWAMNPKRDTLDGLASYLCEFAQEFLEADNIRCRLDIPSQLPAWLLSAESRHNLFLASKEALNNIARHAQATEVRIALQVSDSAFDLLIEDNGRGFSTESAAPTTPGVGAKATGNGLTNMRKRLEQIGGSFEITSQPGGGTRIRFALRLHGHSTGPAQEASGP